MEFGDKIIEGAKNALRSHDAPQIPKQVERINPREITFPMARTEFPEPKGHSGLDLANAVAQGIISTGDALRIKPAGSTEPSDKGLKFYYVEPDQPTIDPRSMQPRMAHVLYSTSLSNRTFVSVGDIGEWEKLDETIVPTFVRKAIERRNKKKNKIEEISRLRRLLMKIQRKQAR